MKFTIAIIVLNICCLLHSLQQSEDITENEEILETGSAYWHPCPNLTLSDENPWCLNCTFVNELGCNITEDHTKSLFSYKLFKCTENKDCILPIRSDIYYRPKNDEYEEENCPDMKKNKPSLLCNNCTTVKDDRCHFHDGVYCQYREYKCSAEPCFVLHNCTAGYSKTFPHFVPKLVTADGSETLKQETKGDCEHVSSLEENPSCINCLYEKPTSCTTNTNYTDTTCDYKVFNCPLNNGKKCVLPTSCETGYKNEQKDIPFCPNLRKIESNNDCTNCTYVKKTECSFLNDHGTHVSCEYRTYSCPEYCMKLGGCIAPIGIPQEDISHINPTALASLAGAG